MDDRGIMEKTTLTAIMPALNEEKNIVLAIENTLKAFSDFQIDGEILVINDGSTDHTKDLVCQIMAQDPRVKKIDHETPQGIGASFWDGVAHTQREIVVMLPGDNENDPWEIFRYFELLNQVDLVIPFVFNKEVRSIFRNILSFIYRFIINTTFLVYFNYTNGTILYRRNILEELPFKSKGFFFQTDILIRLVKKGYLFAEVPYKLGLRNKGISKAVSFPSLWDVVKGYLRLVKDFYGRKSIPGSFSDNSLTAVRRNDKSDSFFKENL